VLDHITRIMADDIGLSLSPVRKNVVKQGRRAVGESEAVKESWTDVSPPGEELFGENNIRSEAGRRGGGWAQSRNNSLQQRLSSDNKTEEQSEEEEELPIIPDLEEFEKEDLAQRVADAPNVTVTRVDTYKELDSDLFKHAAFATLEEIDLRLLTRNMVPEQSLREQDETWTWDTLFAEVSSQMQSEWFPASEAVNENQESQEKMERPYTAFNRFPV